MLCPSCSGYNIAQLNHKNLWSYIVIFTDKLKVGFDGSFNQATLPGTKYVPPVNGRKVPGAKSLVAVKQDTRKGSNLEPKDLKRKVVRQTNVHNDLGSRNIINSQGADGSGITSTKEATSTRTPAERLREPLPCQGRKELISLLQKALRNPNYEASDCPGPRRKRVVAPPGKVGKELVYITPMPLHSNGIAVAGAGLMNKGPSDFRFANFVTDQITSNNYLQKVKNYIQYLY